MGMTTNDWLRLYNNPTMYGNTPIEPFSGNNLRLPGFFQKGFSDSPLGKKMTRGAGWANAGLQVLNTLNNGASNDTGNTLSSIGGLVGSIPTPYTAVAGTVLSGIGSIVNGFTNSVNKEHLKAVSKLINNLATTTSNASNYEGLQSDYNQLSNTNIDLGNLDQWGSKGFFIGESNSARYKARNSAREAVGVAKLTALGNLQERGKSINQSNFNNYYSKLMADGGAIDYAFANDYLHNGFLKATKDNQLSSLFEDSNNSSLFAEGGNMYSNQLNDYIEGATYNISEEEYNRLIKEGYLILIINK